MKKEMVAILGLIVAIVGVYYSYKQVQIAEHPANYNQNDGRDVQKIVQKIDTPMTPPVNNSRPTEDKSVTNSVTLNQNASVKGDLIVGGTKNAK